jgi:hypothetical protein
MASNNVVFLQGPSTLRLGAYLGLCLDQGRVDGVTGGDPLGPIPSDLWAPGPVYADSATLWGLPTNRYQLIKCLKVHVRTCDIDKPATKGN